MSVRIIQDSSVGRVPAHYAKVPDLDTFHSLRWELKNSFDLRFNFSEDGIANIFMQVHNDVNMFSLLINLEILQKIIYHFKTN